LVGQWDRKKLLVTAPLLRNTGRGGERVVKVSKAGKFAETYFRRLQKYNDSTLIEASPKTGRTHQIRVHAAWLGHPIVGDAKYGNQEDNRRFNNRGYKHLFLHAQQLQFTHPVSGEVMTFNAPLTKKLQSLLINEAKR